MQSVPFVIAGNVKKGAEHKKTYESDKGKITVGLPGISDNDIKRMKGADKEEMHDLSIDEIILFLTKVGKLWSSEKYEKRKELIDLTCMITGYSRPMVELGMQQIQGMLSRKFLEITLKSDLGDKRLLDEWLPRGEASVHCQPRGVVLHVLAGNVPAVTIMSLINGILSKNCNIARMSSRDVITASYFVSSFADVDQEHPVTKTTSAIYWPSNRGDILDKFLSFANCVCTWGGRDAVESIRKKAPYEVELLEFGPRRGIQLIGREASKNLKQIAARAAHDLTLFDQEACFSPQIAFVEGNAEKYAQCLAENLEAENKKLPRGFSALDAHAAISHTRMYSKFRGHKVFHPDKTDWTVIITKNVEELPVSHPMGRTIFLIPVKDIRESLKYIGSETQVVAVEPFDRGIELREALTGRGVDRVTRLGKMGYFAVGAPHEGTYPLSRMVRWVKCRQ
jgi:long-chain-fatty-acyl-CoA reductase